MHQSSLEHFSQSSSNLSEDRRHQLLQFRHFCRPYLNYRGDLTNRLRQHSSKKSPKGSGTPKKSPNAPETPKKCSQGNETPTKSSNGLESPKKSPMGSETPSKSSNEPEIPTKCSNGPESSKKSPTRNRSYKLSKCQINSILWYRYLAR